MDNWKNAMNTISLNHRPIVKHLTLREVEVLSLAAQGLTNNEIADTLFLSAATVSFHLNNVYGKLGVKNRVRAYREALRLGLLPEEVRFQNAAFVA